MHEKRVQRTYLREMGMAFVLYAVLLILSIKFGRPMQEGVLRTIVLFCPMIGFCVAIWAVARQLGRIDEYQRLMTLENLALSAAITAGLSFSYGFLETAGYPRLPMFSVWMVMGSAWFVVQQVRCRMCRG